MKIFKNCNFFPDYNQVIKVEAGIGEAQPALKEAGRRLRETQVKAHHCQQIGFGLSSED